MSLSIHSTAVVHPDAQLADGVIVGPYCIIGAHVRLDTGVKLHSHVVIDGYVKIGERTEIFPFVTIGLPPQNRNYQGESSVVEIGHDTILREHVTVHAGTEKGGMRTTIGNHCFIMVGSHIAHDCHIGHYVTMANNATLAGHVVLGDYCIIGGLAAIHQFVRIGPYAMIGGTAGVKNDIIPFGTVTAIAGKLSGLNIIGMKRRGVARDDIHALRASFRLLASEDNLRLEEKIQIIKEKYAYSSAVKELITFIDVDSQRPLCLPSNIWEFEQES